MKKIIFASNNVGKINEIKEVFKNTGFEILSLKDVGYSEDIPEDFLTYEENAYFKAETIYQKFGLPVIADDTGFEVYSMFGKEKSLKGLPFPGVHSARIKSDHNIDENIEYVLSKIENVPFDSEDLNNNKGREGRAVSVICFIGEKGQRRLFRGETEGVYVPLELRSPNFSFGYRSVFLPKDDQGVVQNKLFGDMTMSESNKYSQRYKALNELFKYIDKSFK